MALSWVPDREDEDKVCTPMKLLVHLVQSLMDQLASGKDLYLTEVGWVGKSYMLYSRALERVPAASTSPYNTVVLCLQRNYTKCMMIYL